MTGGGSNPRALRAWCEAAGLTLDHLAREAGLTPNAMHKIAARRREPLITTALSLTRALGINVEDVAWGG